MRQVAEFKRFIDGVTGEDYVRGVLLEVDSEGYKTVRDVVEVPRNPRQAARFFMKCFGKEWLFSYEQIVKVDAGRVRSTEGLLRRMLEQM